MYHIAEQRLARLINTRQKSILANSLVGLEKESLRVSPEGNLSQALHPRSLGSPLTHPYITTDYSEALVEFITPPLENITDVLNFLRDTQCFVYGELDNELLWATSMPCVVAGETSIPIAKYGRSNSGMMKTVYRRGLGHRYGRVMQTIAGVHFNYSFPDTFWPVYQDLEHNKDELQDFISESYFGLIRNLQRFGWLVPYLFGASPAVCKSFLGGEMSSLESFNENTYYQPYATSLRMGDIGYQNNQEAKSGVKACYDNLDAYVDSLTRAINTPYKGYEDIGVKVDGEYRQLNANILQIENEYYSTIRPKQIVGPFEKPTHALKRRGVRYVELRSIDVNAFDPLGIKEQQLRFLEAFLVFCLLHDSPIISDREREHIDHNELAAAHRGRDPHLHLYRDGEKVLLAKWANEVLTAMEGVCDFLDAGLASGGYRESLELQMEKVRDPDKTPSARMLDEMRENGEGFFQFALRKSMQHQEYFKGLDLPAEFSGKFRELTEETWLKQKAIEESEVESFDNYLQRYFNQQL
ncbi:glutamate--cysteine ligase [Kaarinaea lacus]